MYNKISCHFIQLPFLSSKWKVITSFVFSICTLKFCFRLKLLDMSWETVKQHFNHCHLITVPLPLVCCVSCWISIISDHSRFCLHYLYHSYQPSVICMLLMTFGCCRVFCYIATVQFRCNFKLVLLSNLFTLVSVELLAACALLLKSKSYQIIRWSSGVVSDTITHVSLWYHVIDHHNVHRSVLRLLRLSRSQNLCHRALIH